MVRYNTLQSYVYDGNAPNTGVGLHFRTQQGAEDFEKAVVGLNYRSILLGHSHAIPVKYMMWSIPKRNTSSTRRSSSFNNDHLGDT